jgi:hypothetical protein
VDVIFALPSADPEAVIYASAPLTPRSEAMICAEAESPAGLDYLLEVALAREVLHVWADWRHGRQPTPEQAARAVIHYAQHDAYEPVQ